MSRHHQKLETTCELTACALVLFYFGTTRAKATSFHISSVIYLFHQKGNEQKKRAIKRVIEAKLGGWEEHAGYMLALLLPKFPGTGDFFFLWNTLFFSQPCENTVTLKALRGTICWSTDSVPPIACIPFLGTVWVRKKQGEIHPSYTVSSKPAREKLHFLSCEILNLFSCHVIV